MTPCNRPGCRVLCEGGYCPAHQTKPEGVRPTSRQRGYTTRWDKARKTFLEREENALCRYCTRHGRVEPATIVDHIVPHRGDQKLFWDVTNWQPLCERCHNAKTASGQ